MTVARKGTKGRRYVLLHAGCENGWIGEPRVWEANSTSKDYHENMNSAIFEEYMESLCKFCKDKGHEKVVFCMDNAKYHRREAQLPDTPEGVANKTLSQLNKGELIQRLQRMNPELVETELKKLKKPQIYEMAKRPEYKMPLSVEEITRR